MGSLPLKEKLQMLFNTQNPTEQSAVYRLTERGVVLNKKLLCWQNHGEIPRPSFLYSAARDQFKVCPLQSGNPTAGVDKEDKPLTPGPGAPDLSAAINKVHTPESHNQVTRKGGHL